MIILPINCDIFKYQSRDSQEQTYLWQRLAENVMSSLKFIAYWQKSNLDITETLFLIPCDF